MSVRIGWLCDTCNELILREDDGWIEWLMYRDADGSYSYSLGSLRLVHHCSASPRGEYPGCQYTGGALDDHLHRFLGPDGLMELLSFIERGFDVEEVMEMIKRLHLPGYEHARFYLEEAACCGASEPCIPEGFPYGREIAATLAYMDEKGY
jgi:hypothetical protein